ncbi:DUF5711 family protein [Ruminococcaceae bacterium OttesenSCG-928-O06]|nr:DUF5711 family protein [Ruminococcaceae bacterium OttesenSCG-928-O06]
MADKKGKKPKHTNLVVPGSGTKKEDTEKDRMGRTLPADAPVPGAAGQAPPDAEAAATPGEKPENKPKKKPKGKAAAKAQPVRGPAAPAGPGAEGTPPAAQDDVDDGPPKAVPLPKKRGKKPLSPVRRKRRRRRIQALVLAVLVLLAFVAYSNGLHLTVATQIADGYDSLRIALRPGDGFPMDFSLPGFVKTQALGGGGFVAVGEKEATFISSSGAALRTLQHNYYAPGISTGKTRAVLYGIGGRQYTVEGRSNTLATGTTDQDILFCTMSSGGRLAVVTASRHRAVLQIYGTSYDATDPLLRYDIVDDHLPVLAAFHSDNRNLVLGCVSASGGALGSTLYLLRTGRDAVVATIRAEDAVLLNAAYLDNNRILAVYDSYTALYNNRGEEVARYSYGGRSPLTSQFGGGMLTLVFGASSQESMQTVLLRESLETVFEVQCEAIGTPSVLPVKDGVFLLAGGEVYAYTLGGALADTLQPQQRPLALVNAGQPLLLVVGRALPLAELLQTQPASSAAQSAESGSGSTGSAPAGSADSGLDDSGDTSSSEDASGTADTSGSSTPDDISPAAPGG